MDYKKAYDSLMNRAIGRDLGVYVEKHHIIPRCMGGSDDEENLISLLPEEHYIAHLLLVKIYPSSSRLVFAANMMANRNNKSYGWIKRKFAEENSKIHTGMKHSEKSKQKMSVKRKGIPKSSKHKASMSKAKTKELEYKGNFYYGYKQLKEHTKVTYHLYNKFYLKGIDPEKYIGNNTYAWGKNRKMNNVV